MDQLEDLELGPGDLVGRYHVLERVGSGGMGVVYSAFDPDLDRKVALKVLLPERLDGDASSRGHARLIREAKAMAKLSHPNVVTVHDVGVFASRVFVAMEFVDGQTLSQWFGTEPSWEEVIRCMTLAGRGLAAAHAKGLVHRDFKPDNVLIGADGRPRVLDFGLARAPSGPTELREEELELRTDVEGPDRITRTGGLTGTPAYMAPEQYLGKPLDARTDQFSFCVALWEGLHGERPFQGGSTAALGMAVCSGERTPPPSTSQVPSRIQRVLDRGLSLDPAERFPSMDALLSALDLRPSSSRKTLWLGLGGVALVGGVALWPATPQDPCREGQADLARAWNPTRAEAVRAGFQRSEVAFAASSADAVVTALDDYATQWGNAYQEACEATHVHGRQSVQAFHLRAGCLAQHLRALETTADMLAEANDTSVTHAPRAVNRLPSMDVCASVESVGMWAPPPEDLTLARTVQAIREQLAALSARARIRIHDKTGTEADAVLVEARATEHDPVIAEAQLVAAKFALVAGRHADAVAQLEDTVYTALASDHDRVLAMALTQLTQATGILLSHYDEGLRWSKQAEAAVLRLGDHGDEAAEFHAVMCKLLADKGDTDEALPHCHRNVELSEELYGKDSVGSAAAYESLGIAYFYGHRSHEAKTQFERARDSFARGAGDTHPAMARITNSLAAVCYQTRGAKPCLGAFAEGVRLSSAAYGDAHPMTADFRNNLAQMHVDSKQFDEAKTLAQQALQARRQISNGNAHPGAAASLRILAVVDRNAGAFDDARAKLDEAMAIVHETRGKAHRDVVSVLREQALVEEATDQRARARALATRGLELGRALELDISELEELMKRLDQPAEDKSSERSDGTR